MTEGRAWKVEICYALLGMTMDNKGNVVSAPVNGREAWKAQTPNRCRTLSQAMALVRGEAGKRPWRVTNRVTGQVIVGHG